MRPIFTALIVLFTLASAPLAFAAGKAKHVVVIVWDGMRPDFITPENTPTLFQLAHEGVRFDNHHPVFPPTTEVNGTAISTGAYPAHDGIIANREFRPEIDSSKVIATEDFAAMRKGDSVSHNHYVRIATMAEILRQKGMRTVIAGAKPVALLHDRAERPANVRGINLFAGKTLPENALEKITQALGPFPEGKDTNTTRNDWTTRAAIEQLWQNGVPEFSLLWMNEPDYSQHRTGPGSPRSLAAIKNADDNLARVLVALEAKGVRNETDILLVSDHGFSTIQSVVDIAESMREAGLNAFREFTTTPAKGDIILAGEGGSSLVYVTGHDSKVIEKVVHFLQGWKYTGVIFTRKPMEGTFPMSRIHSDSPDQPDVLFTFRWNADRNDFGTPGMLIVDSTEYGPGQGMHGTLSAFEMHNTFVANGPDFRSGIVDHLPTGNTDVAPTVLWILGVRQPSSMDGRVVSEAMNGIEAKIKSFEPQHIEVMRDLGGNIWHQYLNFTTVNGVDYFDEGNGAQVPK